MSAIDSSFLSKWFTGKALQNVTEALNLLNESIALGYWAPKASVKVPAAFRKSNVIKNVGSALESSCKKRDDYYKHPCHNIAHNAYFGIFEKLASCVAEFKADKTVTDEDLLKVARVADFVKDMELVVAAIEKLNKESDANKKLATASKDGNASGICACCFRTQKVKPDGTMFKHGYERPGFGYIIGGCPGDQFKPYAV